MPAAPRLIALHLPQYYPIPENDANWGPGFTEWTHVTAARRLYPGHWQPQLPADLGFYDLRLAEVRQAQADLAKAYGIEGFCFWHYWFAGHRVLERPVQEIVRSGKPDLPFCLGWANATWTGVWYGAPDRVLIEQTYPGEDDHRAHFDAVLPKLLDPRYIRVDGCPMFLVFLPGEIPEVASFCALWRDLAVRAGLPGLHLVAFGGKTFLPKEHGFDASVLHGPKPRPRRRFLHKLFGLPAIGTYRRFVERGIPEAAAPQNYPIAIANWDNTPRAGRRGVVLHGATPELFRIHLRQAIERVAERPPEHQIVFLKSWNEWAEGNYLEPSARFGHGFLEIVREEAERAEHASGPS